MATLVSVNLLLVGLSTTANADLLNPLDFSSLGTLSLSAGNYMIDTDSLTIVDDTAPGVPLFTGVADDQNGTADYLNGVWVPGSMGIPEIAVFTFDDIDLPSSANITVTGTRALALLSHGNVMIDTTIDLSGESVPAPAVLGDPAPAGVGKAGGFSGGFAAYGLPAEDGEGPGGGSGATVVGNSGGFGGPGYRNSQPDGGPAYGDLVDGPLQGGSGGGSAESFALGGAAGGGALDISALGGVTLGASGNLLAAGGTTEGVGSAPLYVGGGAGSGGSIRIQGQSVELLGVVDVRSFYAAFPALTVSDGGGGRVAVFGLNQLFDFVVGQTSTASIDTSNINVEGGCSPSGDSCHALTRGLISISPQVTTIPSGQSLTLGQVTDLSDANRRLELVHHNIRVRQGGQAIVPGEGYVNAGRIELFPGGSSITGPGTLTNQGELSGSGTVAVAVENSAGGSIDAINDVLNFAQAVSNGSGATINSISSTLTFPGDGTPTSGGGDNTDGLTNNGNLNLISTTIYGDVHSPAGSTISVGGSGVVFEGLVSGGANFPNVGAVTFNGGYAPGDSPAHVSLGGDLTLGGTNTLYIEIGGIVAESEYDVLQIDGSATLAGALDVSLIALDIDPFAPALDNTFTILTATGGISGVFDTQPEDLPALSAGLDWAINYDTNDVVLAVIATGLPGDYSGNDTIDAADYTVWRDALTAGSSILLNDPTPGVVDESDFLYWRAHFGETLGSGAGTGQAAVPEPSTLALMLLASAAWSFRRRKMHRKYQQLIGRVEK